MGAQQSRRLPRAHAALRQLTRERLAEDVAQTNVWLEDHLGARDGHVVHVAIVDPDVKMLWKVRTKVTVWRQAVGVDGAASRPADPAAAEGQPRVIGLTTFYSVFFFLADELASSDALGDESTASMACTELSEGEELEDGEDDLCCICMEESVDTILTCSHGFCHSCVADWVRQTSDDDGGSTCPICRRAMDREQDNAWVVLDANEHADMRTYLQDTIARLVDGHP